MKKGKELFKELELFIFDMDGLLFDTEAIYVKKGKEIAKRNGCEITDKFIEKTTGLPMDTLRKIYVEELGEKFPFDAHWEEIKECVYELAIDCRVPLKKGAREILEFLKKNNKKMVLGTSSNFEMAKKLLKSQNIFEYFSYLITSDHVKKGKPNPEVFLMGAEIMGISTEKSMVFEDSFNGIRAAHSAGMLPVMIPDLLNPTKDIESLLFAKFDNLLDVINYFSE